MKYIILLKFLWHYLSTGLERTVAIINASYRQRALRWRRRRWGWTTSCRSRYSGESSAVACRVRRWSRWRGTRTHWRQHLAHTCPPPAPATSSSALVAPPDPHQTPSPVCYNISITATVVFCKFCSIIILGDNYNQVLLFKTH